LTDGTETLAYLVSDEGPNGKAISAPIKISDNDEDFTFNNMWTIAAMEDNNTLSGYNVGDKINQNDFVNLTPKGDISFTANYTSSDRKYKVTLYDEDGTTVLVETTLKWNDNIGEGLSEYSESYYNYKPYDG
jgi:hypothetical protein